MPRRHGSKLGNSPGGRKVFRSRKQRKTIGRKRQSRGAMLGFNNDRN